MCQKQRAIILSILSIKEVKDI